MQRRTIFAVLLVGFAFLGLWAAVIGPAQAADLTVLPQHARPATPAMLRAEGSPFRPSKRAQAVLDSRACWSACQSTCTWGEAACLTADAQGRCLHYTDRCDRVCQSDCRMWGGPLLGFVD
jgi:hypothetical protein